MIGILDCIDVLSVCVYDMVLGIREEEETDDFKCAPAHATSWSNVRLFWFEASRKFVK